MSKRKTRQAKKKQQQSLKPGSCPAQGELHQWLHLYLQGRHDDLCRIFCERLEHHSKVGITRLQPETKHRLDTFLQNFLHIFCQPDFKIAEPYSLSFISYLPTISNLLAISSFRNADPWLNILSRQPGNFVKILTLYGPKAAQIIEPAKLFAIDPRLATAWYMFFWHCLAVSDPKSLARFESQMTSITWEFVLPVYSMLAWPYFHPTYIDPKKDRIQKEAINRAVQQQVSYTPPGNAAQEYDIAVVSSRWYGGSAVYKSISPFVDALAQNYRLVLIHCTPEQEKVDTSGFADVVKLVVQPSGIDLSPLQKCTFKAAFFPDVGMTYESILLSNLRLTPVQVAGYGHPSSTWGAEIDYFLGGDEVELHDLAQANYSEQLVLAPGLGAYPVFPEVIPEKKATTREERIVINCSWGAMKTNAPLVAALREICLQGTQPTTVRFFPNWVLNANNSYLPFRHDLLAILKESGAQVEVIGNLPAPQYMELLAEGFFALDSYPFGGYNTIVDSLLLGIPIVAWEGEHACNRLASALLRRLGLTGLIATNRQEYIALGVRLMKDRQWRQGLVERIAELDLSTTLLRREEADAVPKIFAYLLANHQRLCQQKERSVIRYREVT